jgi:hypothetical protein
LLDEVPHACGFDPSSCSIWTRSSESASWLMVAAVANTRL